MKRNDWFIRVARNRDLEPDAESGHFNNLRRMSDMITSKPAWQSKTLWASALVAIVPFVPGVGPVASAWIAANPDLFAAGLGALFAALRAATSGKVSIG